MWHCEQALLAVTADVDAVHDDKSAMTALMAAASNGSVPLVERLLRAGAAVDGRNSDGVTALMHAAVRDLAEIRPRSGRDPAEV